MARPRSFGSAHVTLRLPIQIWPALTSIRPAIAFGPNRTRNSLSRTCRSSPWKTFAFPNSMNRPRMSMALTGSTFHRAGGDAAHEPLSGQKVDQQWDESGLQGGGHVDVVFVRAEL